MPHSISLFPITYGRTLPCHTQYKQRMLGEMRSKLLSSAISEDNGGRLGGQRVVPLYESERLVGVMERAAEERLGRQWEWPHRSPTRPRPQTAEIPTVTALVEYIGRFDTKLTRRPGTAAALITYPVPLTPSRSLPALATTKRH